MKVKKLIKLLKEFDKNQEVVLINEDRMRHDDMVLEFDIVQGFSNDENDPDQIRLKKGVDDVDPDDYDDGDELPTFDVECVVIRCNAGG